MRYLRALAAAGALLVTVVGIPVLLAVTVGNPLAAWPDLVAGDLSDAVVVNVLATVAYLAWAQFALAVTAELIAAVTRVRVPARLPLVPTGQRRLVRALVASAFLLTPATSSALPLAFPPQHAVIATAPATISVGTVVPTANGVGPAGVAARVAHPEAASRSSTDKPPTYTIRRDGPGTYWDLAEHFLGEGQRWHEIWRLNDGRRQDDGALMSSPGLLRPGWTVILPAAAVSSQTQPAAVETNSATPVRSHSEVTVKAGDSLWSIAKGHLDDGRAWPTLFRLNQGKVQPDGRQLTDPDLIHPGWVLRLPDRRPEPTTPPTSAPTAPADPGTTPAASPPSSNPPTSGPSSGGPTTSGMPSTTAATPAEPDAAQTVSPSPEAADHHAETAHGVDLPNGWVSLPFAAAISAAGALVWLRRRHRHRYTPHDDLDPDNLVSEDPDLQPLPAVVHRMRQAVHDLAPHLLDPPSPSPTIADYVADPDGYHQPPTGPSGLDLAGLGELAHPSGLGLTGPGADAAARALLVATLSSGGATDPDAQGRVVVPAPLLQELLDGEADATERVARLQVTSTLDAALEAVEKILFHRRRILDEYAVDDLDELRANDPTHPPMPPVLLLAHTPPAEGEARLATLLHQGRTVDIRAVLLGDWPRGATARLDTDGWATIDRRAIRVATLDPSTAAQLLQVVREAEPEPQDPVSPSNQPSTNSEACRAVGGAAMERAGAEEGGDATVATDGDVGDRVLIRVFGRVAVLDKAGQPTPGLRQHAGGLLAYLVVHRPGADKNDIMEALWPDASVRRAAERLSTEVGNLRRCIRQAAQNQDAQPVVNTGGRYHLNPDVVDVDVWRFHDVLRQATTATDPAQRVQALQAAVSMYTGSMADRHDYHWLEPVRERLRRNVIRAHLHLADLVSPENPRHAADLTAAAARLDLASEELARLAMEASSRVGDTVAVAAQLRQLRSALRDIDEEPSSETLTLAAQLQTHEPRRSDPLASPTRQSG